jgi:hypothetical protein
LADDSYRSVRSGGCSEMDSSKTHSAFSADAAAGGRARRAGPGRRRSRIGKINGDCS